MASSLNDCLNACFNSHCPEYDQQITDVFVSCTSACYTDDGWAVASSSSGDDNLYVNALIALFLLIFSGLFSGLTLGLMSLDTVGLKIIAEGGTAEERGYANKILPIRTKGNLLLCTLLLGNTLVNAMIAILTADMTSGVLGGLISTFLIVIFGEIIPQAACSRHGLAIGAKTIWLVQIFIVLMFVVAWPISLVLDQVLGSDIGSVYSKNELKELINIHVENPDAAEESGLTRDDQTLITGALEYKDKHVRDVMTSLDMIYMVELNQRLNFQLLFEIYKSGFTRIPVYEGDRQNVVGILFAKDLILIDPDDEIEVRAILAFHGDRSAGYVKKLSDNTKLDRVFKYFKSSFIHLLFAYRGKAEGEEGDELGGGQEITGIISLEDVLEAVIQQEIVDETDNFVDVNEPNQTAVVRRKSRRDLSQFMSLFEHKMRSSSKLSRQEINAISAYLTTNVNEFKLMSNTLTTLKELIRAAELLENNTDSTALSLKNLDEEAATSGLAQQPIDSSVEHQTVLYRRNVVSDYFVLILQGRVQIQAGAEHFASELGPWTVIGNAALTNEVYYPDFDASMVGPCRILLVRKTAYQMALRVCQGEYLSQNQPINFSGKEVKSEETPNMGDGKKEQNVRSRMISTMSLPVATMPPTSENHSYSHSYSHVEKGVHDAAVDSSLHPSASEDNLQRMSMQQMTNTQWSHSKIFTGKDIAAFQSSPEPNGGTAVREVNNKLVDSMPQHFKPKLDNDGRTFTEGFVFEALSKPGFDY